MSRCLHCEVLPDPPALSGTLFIASPLHRTRAKLRRALLYSGMFFTDPEDGVLAVEVEPGGLDPLGELLLDSLTEAELRDSRALLMQGDRRLGLGDLVRVEGLGALLAAARGGWLLETLREERLAVHFQPIVSADDAGDVFAYECLLRGMGSDGATIPPRRMFETARSTGVLFYLDRTARLRAIEEVTRLGLDTLAFINFNPAAIHDPASCLHSTVDAVKRSRIPADSLVFEVTESAGVRDARHLSGVLSHYRDAGFRVALDDLGSGPNSLKLLARVRPDFAKLDAGLVRGVDSDPHRAAAASRLLEAADDLGVRIVAEGVETAGQHDWLVAHGASYLQGYYLAYPDRTPPAPTHA